METLTGPDEAAEWVRARKAEGSDWIKIIYEDGSAFDMEIPSLDGETVAAVIEAAHAEGLAAVVHVSTIEAALEAMAFGANGLVHVWRDEVVSEADARRFAEADIFVVPTLSVMVPAEDSGVAELVRETDEAMLSAIQRQTLAARFPGGLAEGGDVAMENVRRLRAAGSPKAISPTWCWCAATSRKTCRAATTSSRSGRMGTWWIVLLAPRAPGLGPRSRPLLRKPWSRTSRTGSRRASANGM